MINLVLRLFILISVASIGSCSSLNKKNPQEKFKMATLYFQRAPEVKALYYQAYNGARKYLNERIDQSKGKQCVVLDIDETVLDNSPYQGWLYQNKATYSSLTWESWVNRGIAVALPGVVDFIHYAQKQKVAIYLITNRKHHLEDITFKNLISVGIKVPRDHLVGRHKTSSKVVRRNNIAKKCQIVLMAGDSLADFHEDFEGSVEARSEAVHKFKALWGNKYIVLPNPMYGDWVRKSGRLPLKGIKVP